MALLLELLISFIFVLIVIIMHVCLFPLKALLTILVRSFSYDPHLLSLLLLKVYDSLLRREGIVDNMGVLVVVLPCF